MFVPVWNARLSKAVYNDMMLRTSNKPSLKFMQNPFIPINYDNLFFLPTNTCIDLTTTHDPIFFVISFSNYEHVR